MLVVAADVLSGCRGTYPPGPVLALYAKDGGPAFQKGPGVCDPLAVGGFFKAHPEVLPSFVDHALAAQQGTTAPFNF